MSQEYSHHVRRARMPNCRPIIPRPSHDRNRVRFSAFISISRLTCKFTDKYTALNNLRHRLHSKSEAAWFCNTCETFCCEVPANGPLVKGPDCILCQLTESDPHAVVTHSQLRDENLSVRYAHVLMLGFEFASGKTWRTCSTRQLTLTSGRLLSLADIFLWVGTVMWNFHSVSMGSSNRYVCWCCGGRP